MIVHCHWMKKVPCCIIFGVYIYFFFFSGISESALTVEALIMLFQSAHARTLLINDRFIISQFS